MSKRFGRNQRRKMRERVAQLETANNMNLGLLNHLGRKNDELMGIVRTVAQMIAPEYAGLPATDRALPHNTFPEFIDMPLHRPFCVDAANVFDPVCVVERLHTLHGDELQDEQRNLHMRFTLAGGRVGYAISESALRQMPRSRLVERIADEMARQMVISMGWGRDA